MEKSSSLVTRLIHLLSITLMTIWLISITTTMLFSYEDTRQQSKYGHPITQVYDTGGQTYYFDSYTINKKEGFTIFKPQEPVLHQISFSLTIFLLLTLSLYLLLWSFINIINVTGTCAIEPRSLIKHMDESWYITHTYNYLVNNKCDILEIKEKERTPALVKSK
ncbi:hypothetical protein ACRBEF_11320 [Yersinia proxima]|uniref:hypothetical protein n=1 Tax=Yersinia proxima TaxID=2890316 RepID=UPI001D12D2FD|nr:hypothetical protein [Yersinia proxima]